MSKAPYRFPVYMSGAAVLFGCIFWFVDGILDWLVFNAGYKSLLDALFMKISFHEAYMRLSVIFACLAGALIARRVSREDCEHKQEDRSREKTLQFQNTLLKTRQAEAELEHAKELVEAANRTKSGFLANMSHEFRTPLNGILGFAQILQRDETLNPRQKEAVSAIQESGKYLLLLLNDILDLAKMEAGKMELNPYAFNLLDFLNSIADIIRPQARKKGLDFLCEFSPDLTVAVYADEIRLRQVLLNLLGNAVKFTEQGKVVFSVSSDENKTCFQIIDTGPGIIPKEFELVFQSFKLAGTRKNTEQGIGLGLAISKKLIKIMSGSLKVESTKGTGSVFRFDLQLKKVKGDMPASSRKKPEQADIERLAKVESSEPKQEVQIGPPPDIAEILYDLAMRGDVEGISEQTLRLQEMDSKYTPFVNEVQRMAGEFKTRQIRKFIKKWL